MPISIDDYHERNIELANLIKDYQLQSETIFFIECFGAEAQQQIKQLSDMGFIIGGHTITHCLLTRTSKGQAKWEIEGNKQMLERLISKEIEWFAYPRGYYDKGIIEMVKDAGYKYARTVLLKDGETNFEKGGIHLSYPRKEYKGKNPFDVAKKSDMRHYWGHTKEFLEKDWFNKLEDFLKWYKKNRKD